MFESAIEKVSQFTRPIHTISRTFGGLILPGAATLFFVNSEGVAITCKHVASMILTAGDIHTTFADYKRERDNLKKDNKYQKNLRGLEIKYKYNSETTVQVRNNFRNSVDKMERIDIHTHPTLDLAILEFKGFSKLFYPGHASFIKDEKKYKTGKIFMQGGISIS